MIFGLETKGFRVSGLWSTVRLIKHTAENTIWANNRKYNMGQKQKIHEEVTAENTSGPNDESPHGGGRRPPHIV